MRLTLSSCGETLATLDADSAWQLPDVLMTLPERFHSTDCRVRVFCSTEELEGTSTLSDVGAGSGAVLTIVRSKLFLSLTASIDGLAKIWSTASGERLHALSRGDSLKVVQ